MIITIDGPVASGKSTTARALAKELGIYYLHTGLLYRAVAYILLEKMKREKNAQIISDDAFEQYISALAPEDFAFIKEISYDYGSQEPERFAKLPHIEPVPAFEARPYLFHGKEEITEHLYSSSLDQPTSIVSAIKCVRDNLLDLQRNVAKKYDIVADGRDCGTVLFPHADYKFYLTADSVVRAQRMLLDKTRGEMGDDLEKAKAFVESRDKRDSEREVAPLVIPGGAEIIDSSRLTFEQVLQKILVVIKRGG